MLDYIVMQMRKVIREKGYWKTNICLLEHVSPLFSFCINFFAIVY